MQAYDYRGHVYYHQKEYELAFVDYSQAVTLSPNVAFVYINRGSAYSQLKRYKQAIADHTQAIALGPNSVLAYTNRGTTYDHLKEYEQALADYTQAIALGPNYTRAYHSRGFAHLYLKNMQQASIDFHYIYVHNPKNSNAAWMAEWTSMGKLCVGREVAERLEVIAAIDSDNDYIKYVCQGVALGLRGKLKEGLQAMEQALAFDPEEWDAYFWQGMLAAYYYRGSRAIAKVEPAITQALEVGLSPILLTPLYWLEADAPDVFVQYAKPLLLKYGI